MYIYPSHPTPLAYVIILGQVAHSPDDAAGKSEVVLLISPLGDQQARDKEGSRNPHISAGSRRPRARACACARFVINKTLPPL